MSLSRPSLVIARPRALASRWEHFNAMDEHPVLAVAGGFLALALLVALLSLWHGANGPLGLSVPVLFLVPVLLAASVGGPVAGAVLAVVAPFVWDWFFIYPLNTLSPDSLQDYLTLFVFLAVAVFTGTYARTARRRTREAVRRAQSSEALYELTMALIAKQGHGQILPTLSQRLRETFDLEGCAILLTDGTDWRVAAHAGVLPDHLRPEVSREAAATAALVSARGVGVTMRNDSSRQSEGAPGNRAAGVWAQFLPLRVGPSSIGVLELIHGAVERADPDQERLLSTFANAVAIVLEHERLSEEERASAVVRESDRLKSALLSSVSHDLRTPLAGIKAGTSSLLRRDVTWSEEERLAFMLDIDTEADRLTRLVSNLLDLSRIESGALRPRKEWGDVAELIERVISRIEPTLEGRRVIRDVSATLPLVRLDIIKIEQALTNILENAVKYSPPGPPITVTAHIAAEVNGRSELCVAVADRGVGIPDADIDRIFDKFYRVADVEGRKEGTGMGLAIVKGLVEAHGGRVAVESRQGEGSTFTLLLPLDPADITTRTPLPAKDLAAL